MGRQDADSRLSPKHEGLYKVDFYVSGNGESSGVWNYLSVFSKTIPSTVQSLNEKRRDQKKRKFSDEITVLKQAGGNEASIKINSSGDRKQIYR